ncbi:MAG: DUF2892 domain-containing protein [Burkholderiaceae bacterium]|nr:MAG: DUF2892 domain-containing protein [Burkholderiaceae bacterium]MBE7426808.1 DUF2892 domain-containing protein [Ideonella sp.]MCC7286416.1 DUF2892 domain-containing protein [Burkholderiaceae bacterium]
MQIENVIRLFAGLVILASLALGAAASPLFHSAHWLWLTVFVGVNLAQSSLTGLCPLETILRRLGVGTAGAACGARRRTTG